jgi:gamma-F420-2:alpha-L-glutamate ligase
MINGIAITNAYVVLPGIAYVLKRMQEEFSKLGVSLKVVSNASIYASISSDGSLKGSLPKADFVLYLDKDPYLSSLLTKLGYRLFDKAEAIRLCDDKMLTYLALTNKGISMPKTISAPLNYSSSYEGDFIANLEKELTYPFISKTNFGSQGQGVTMVHSREELIAREKEIGHSPRLYQENIASSFGHDFRLIIIGGQFIAGMERKGPKGEFRSNIALGGSGAKVNIPANYIEMATKASQILDLDYCGVDLLEGQNKEPVLCEVNSNAFMEGIEKVSGVNIAKAYCTHILKSL